MNCRVDTFFPTEQDYVNLKELTKEQKNSNILLTKKDLIKDCSIEYKLFSIIPYLLGKRGIHYKISSKHKANFKMILSVRNGFVHYKRLNERSSFQNEVHKTSKLWNKLIPFFKNNKWNLGFCSAAFVDDIISTVEERYADSPLSKQVSIRKI